MDKDIKTLKQLIEDERNDDFIEQLEANDDHRQQDYKRVLDEIRRVGNEVRDAKRFDVYRQMHPETSQNGDEMESQPEGGSQDASEYQDQMQ